MFNWKAMENSFIGRNRLHIRVVCDHRKLQPRRSRPAPRAGCRLPPGPELRRRLDSRTRLGQSHGVLSPGRCRVPPPGAEAAGEGLILPLYSFGKGKAKKGIPFSTKWVEKFRPVNQCFTFHKTNQEELSSTSCGRITN